MIHGNERPVDNAFSPSSPPSKAACNFHSSSVFSQDFVYMTLMIATESLQQFDLIVEAFCYKDKKNVILVPKKIADAIVSQDQPMSHI